MRSGPVHIPRVRQAPIRSRYHSPSRRLPRSAVPGIHRVLVRTVQQALRLAGRVETIERARHEIGAYIEHYHRRPHSGLAYRTPLEVATTWRGHQNPEKLQTLST